MGCARLLSNLTKILAAVPPAPGDRPPPPPARSALPVQRRRHVAPRIYPNMIKHLAAVFGFFSLVQAQTESPLACREFGWPEAGKWNIDDDCCAGTLSMGCADGYRVEQSNDVCYEEGGAKAYSYECIPCNADDASCLGNLATESLLACREFGWPEAGKWNIDEDCCAGRRIGCADGYRVEQSNDVCYEEGSAKAYSYECIPCNADDASCQGNLATESADMAGPTPALEETTHDVLLDLLDARKGYRIPLSVWQSILRFIKDFLNDNMKEGIEVIRVERPGFMPGKPHALPLAITTRQPSDQSDFVLFYILDALREDDYFDLISYLMKLDGGVPFSSVKILLGKYDPDDIIKTAEDLCPFCLDGVGEGRGKLTPFQDGSLGEVDLGEDLTCDNLVAISKNQEEESNCDELREDLEDPLVFLKGVCCPDAFEATKAKTDPDAEGAGSTDPALIWAPVLSASLTLSIGYYLFQKYTARAAAAAAEAAAKTAVKAAAAVAAAAANSAAKAAPQTELTDIESQLIEAPETEAPDVEAPETETQVPEGEIPEIEQEEEVPVLEINEEEGAEDEDDEVSMFSMSSSGSSRTGKEISNQSCEVLLLDHLSMSYKNGCQDALKAFYVEFLACTVDPRKKDNYDSGKKTFFFNIRSHQFRLLEGSSDASLFDGVITLVYEDLNLLMNRYKDFLDGTEMLAPLKETEFCVNMVDEKMMVTDPWGRKFVILSSDHPEEDLTKSFDAQPLIKGHAPSEGLKLENVTVYVKHGANLEGIGRFYKHVLGALVVHDPTTDSSISIAMGQQTLTFQLANADATHIGDAKPIEGVEFIEDVIKHDPVAEAADDDGQNYDSDSSYGGYQSGGYDEVDEEFDEAVEDAVIGVLESGVKGTLEALGDGTNALEGGLEEAAENIAEGAKDVAVAGAKKMINKLKKKKDKDDLEEESGVEVYPPNDGPHVSLFVTNLPHAYEMASDLGVQYVNTRFGRRAYTKEQVIEQSMFRFINIVDPEDESDEREVIVQLEHKVRSTRTKDKKKYKSFPSTKV